MMDTLTAYQKIIYIQLLDLNYDIQPLLNELDVNDALELIQKYKLNFDITSFIGKTNSRLLLQKAVELNDVELVKQCLYCNCDFNDTMFNTALRNGNNEIVNILLDKIELEIKKHFHFTNICICKLNHNVIVKYYNLYKDKLGETFYEKICASSSDETFLYFYDYIKDKVEYFSPCITSGKLERVEMMIHLYGKPTEFDITYKRDLKFIENVYILTACRTGNLELVKYLLSIRKTKYDTSCDCIGYVCESENSNLELIQYLHDLGFKPEKPYCGINNYSLPIFEWLLQHGIEPLTHCFDDDGSKRYDFYTMVDNKKIEYLTILLKYCNEKESEKVVKYIITNWDSIGDDIFLPLLKDVQLFSYCKSIQLIEHFLTLGDITEEQWTDLFFNIINQWNFIQNIEQYRCIFDKYRDKLNLNLLALKFMNSYLPSYSPQDKKLIANLLQLL